MTTITIGSTKGKTTGTVEQCVAWLCEMQPSGAYVETADGHEDLDCAGDWTPAAARRAILAATVTDEQIETLRDAAERAGDGAQVAVCRLAMGDSAEEVLGHGYWMSDEQRARIGAMTREQARAECARVAQ